MMVRVPVRATRSDLVRVAAANPAWKVELEPDGTLRLSPPAGGGSGRRNARLTRLLDEFAEAHDYVAFDSSTGFEYADAAIISPDGALVRRERYAALTEDEREGFLPLVPDVVVELVSRWDHPSDLRRKLQDARRRGVAYVVLVDPYRKELWSDGDAPDAFPDLRVVLDL